MRPLFAPLPAGDRPLSSLSREGTTLERFAATAAAGHTIALIVAKDPDAAAVYYFRDAVRAFATYERLDRLNSRPLVVTVSPQGRVLGPTQLDGSSALGCCALAWFAAALRTGEGLEPAAPMADAALALEQPAPADPTSRLPAS